MAASTSSNAVLKAKFRGCMIGVLLGDCLGLPFEGQSPISETHLRNIFYYLMSEDFMPIFKTCKSSTFMQSETTPMCYSYSDDTSMTFSVASSLVDKGEIDIKDMAKRFVDKFINERRGYGAAVRRVFMALYETNYDDVLSPAKAQFEGGGSYGNGAAMRIAPIALFGHSKGEQYIIDGAKQCSLITHAHANGYNGAILQCLAVNAALGLDSSQELDPVKFISNLQEKMESIETEGVTKPYCESLKKIKEIYLQNQDLSAEEIAAHLGNGVAALESVPTAIYSFLRGMKPLKEYKSSNPFMRTLFFSISVGYDTDTIASMAGAIAGAYYGEDIIPKFLPKKCEFFNEVSQLADKLYDVVQKKD